MTDEPVCPPIERAWLLRWKGLDREVPSLSERVVAIRNGALNVDEIKEIVSACHDATKYDLHEKIDALAGKQTYRAEVNDLKTGEKSVTCGHHPFIEARLVENLRLYGNDEGQWTLKWTEGGEENTDSNG